MPATYRLTCCAPWTSEALAGFFALFQARAVNIRRLVVAPVFKEPDLCNLELQFVLPDEPNGADHQQFIEDVRRQLDGYACRRVQLAPL